MNRSDLPAFHARHLLLCTSYLVGISFNKGALAHVATLPYGTLFTLNREPENPWDVNAITVNHEDFRSPDNADGRLGYVQKAHNGPAALLLDSGELVRACLIRKEVELKPNERFTLGVYLQLA